MKIGIIGAGKMGQALVKGLISSGLSSPEEIYCSRTNIQLLDSLKQLGCHITTDNLEVVKNTLILIIAVKPYMVCSVLKEVKDHITLKHLVISVAMGVTTTQMEKELPRLSRVIRVVPNTPSLVLEGASMFSCGHHTLKEDVDTARQIFSSVGICDQIEEKLLDAVTGVSGCGPAYMYLAIEALADGGVKMGIRRDISLKLAAQTLLGAAKMVLETGQHPGSLKDDVCSPAGATIRGIHELEKNGFRAALISAVEVTAQHSKATSQE